jgi:hypothetical protein
MKAEHRKELETNLLADRMGNLIQRVKGGPKKRGIIYLFGILLAGLIGFVAYNIWKGDPELVARRWIALDRGEWNMLASDQENNNTKKAALFHYAHTRVWDIGVQRLAAAPAEAMARIDEAAELYENLKKMCEGESEWEAEASYALAVIEETRAVIDIKKLTSAKSKYEEVATTYSTTIAGKWAANRKKELSEKDNFANLTKFYSELNDKFHIRDEDKKRTEGAKVNSALK